MNKRTQQEANHKSDCDGGRGQCDAEQRDAGRLQSAGGSDAPLMNVSKGG